MQWRALYRAHRLAYVNVNVGEKISRGSVHMRGVGEWVGMRDPASIVREHDSAMLLRTVVDSYVFASLL